MVLQVLFWCYRRGFFHIQFLVLCPAFKRPSMLKKGHNILLFSLAVVDIVTGEFRQFPSPRGNHTQKELRHKCVGSLYWVM